MRKLGKEIQNIDNNDPLLSSQDFKEEHKNAFFICIQLVHDIIKTININGLSYRFTTM